MRIGIGSVAVGLVIVSILAAQEPESKTQERTKSGETPRGEDEAKSGKGQERRVQPRVPPGTSRVPPGTQKSGFRFPSGPPAAQRGFAPSELESAPSRATRTVDTAERPGLGLPRNLPALPEGRAAGKSLILDVCFAETKEAVPQPVASELLEMERNGKLKSSARVRLLLLENQPAFAQFGELASKVSGHAMTGQKTVPIYTTMSVGTMVQATGRIEEDGTVLMQIYVEKSGLVPSDEPLETRVPESVTRLLAQSTVRLKPGEPAVLSGGPTGGSDEKSQNWIVVSCKQM